MNVTKVTARLHMRAARNKKPWRSWVWSRVAPIGLVAGWFLLSHLWRLREERRLAKTCETHGLLALTYDDGPGSSLTTCLKTALRSAPTIGTLGLKETRGEET